MKRKKQILTAMILSGSVGLGASSLFAQGTPGSGPQPQQTKPTKPNHPAPKTEQRRGKPGTIPERVERPSAGDKGMFVPSDDIKKEKEPLKKKGLNPGPIDAPLDS